MITNSNTARLFAQSIASQAIEVQDAIDTANWDEAVDALSRIKDDLERLETYIDSKAEDAREARGRKS